MGEITNKVDTHIDISELSDECKIVFILFSSLKFVELQTIQMRISPKKGFNFKSTGRFPKIYFGANDALTFALF